MLLRYFDSNHDMKLEYLEFKELVAAARASRQLPIDALSVAKDTDLCLRFITVFFKENYTNLVLFIAFWFYSKNSVCLRSASSLTGFT